MAPIGGGRQIAYADIGEPCGFPVLALHGTPGSRLKFEAADEMARRLGLRLISPDRWGYGLSALNPSPSFRAFAADAAALADHIGFGRFAVLGVSGGGPFAAGVAAHLGARVAALALVSPVGPVTAAGAEADLDAFHRFSFRTLPRIPGALGAIYSGLRIGVRAFPAATLRLLGARACDADRTALLSTPAGHGLLRTFADGLAPGVAGAVLDMQLFRRPWDFDPAVICAPSRLWIGRDDTNVPLRSAVRLAGLIPKCELTLLDGAGHTWCSANFDIVLDWIAGRIVQV